MPYFTRQVAPNGSLIVTALIGVSQARRSALENAKVAVPAPVQILGLIDTGASCTCIDPSVMDQLQVTPTGMTAINTPSTGSVPAPAETFDVSLLIFANVNQPPFYIPTMAVVKSELLMQGFHALIGRDVLANCLLTFDGLNRTFSLAY